MLNEKKIKLMTRLAMYESKQGQEDLKISTYYKKDYTSCQTIISIIWITVGYAIAVCLGAFVLIEEIFANLNFTFILMAGICLITGYLVLVIIYGIISSRFYRKKHEEARQRVKMFNHDLTRLNKMYEREKV